MGATNCNIDGLWIGFMPLLKGKQKNIEPKTQKHKPIGRCPHNTFCRSWCTKKNINVCDTYTINLCLFGDKLLTKVEYGDTHKLILNVMSSILIARQPLAEIP